MCTCMKLLSYQANGILNDCILAPSTMCSELKGRAKLTKASILPVILVENCAWHRCLEHIAKGDDVWLHRQDIDAIAKAVAVEGIPDAPTHDDTTPSATATTATTATHGG